VPKQGSELDARFFEAQTTRHIARLARSLAAQKRLGMTSRKFGAQVSGLYVHVRPDTRGLTGKNGP
jgi:hypothetical protein